MPTPLRKVNKHNAPTKRFEHTLWSAGKKHVVGIDEVGRGAWAGPLTIAAAVIPKDTRLYKVRDSKALNEKERESLYDPIINWCSHWSVGHATNQECDEFGMSHAQKLATKRALKSLNIDIDHALIDGKWDFVGEIVDKANRTMIIKGDAKCLSIATASILAKVTRDRIMKENHKLFPDYAFESNKGYPCPKHKKALYESGPTPLHRISWKYMQDTPYSQAPTPRKYPAQNTLF